jgi:hypothetical protein
MLMMYFHLSLSLAAATAARREAHRLLLGLSRHASLASQVFKSTQNVLDVRERVAEQAMHDMAAHRREPAHNDHHRVRLRPGSTGASTRLGSSASLASQRSRGDSVLRDGGVRNRPQSGATTGGASVADLLRQRTPMGRPISSGRHSPHHPPKSASSFHIFSAPEGDGADEPLDYVGSDQIAGAWRSVASATSLRASSMRDGHLRSESALDEWPPKIHASKAMPSGQHRAISPTMRINSDWSPMHQQLKGSSSCSKVGHVGAGPRGRVETASKGQHGEPLPSLRRVQPHSMQAPGRVSIPPELDLPGISNRNSSWQFQHKAGLVL